MLMEPFMHSNVVLISLETSYGAVHGKFDIKTLVSRVGF